MGRCEINCTLLLPLLLCFLELDIGTGWSGGEGESFWDGDSEAIAVAPETPKRVFSAETEGESNEWEATLAPARSDPGEPGEPKLGSDSGSWSGLDIVERVFGQDKLKTH